MKIYGLDFSGARDAGRKIWIASGQIEGTRLLVHDVHSVVELWGRGRQECLPRLVRFIAAERDAAFGLDFPFGLPKELVQHAVWSDFISAFAALYPDEESFRSLCRKAAAGHELKRLTDRESKTPFSAYDLRLYRQTYFGIRDVLAPLVSESLACVAPMQRLVASKPLVLEICPASTLKREGWNVSYKGRGHEASVTRLGILQRFERSGMLAMDDNNRQKVVTDNEGDALDSVIAALATARAVSDPNSLVLPSIDGNYSIESLVYL